MPEDLPPIAFLRAFSRAAETLSFKQAAAELHLSPSAVSRQIQSLEAHLGVALFRRLNPGLELTPEGRRYLESVHRVLGELRRAQDGLVAPRSGPLRVSALQSFTESWLIPHLADFERAHPGVELRVEATLRYRRLRARPGRRRDSIRHRSMGRSAQRADRRPDVLPRLQPDASGGRVTAPRARRVARSDADSRPPNSGRVARLAACRGPCGSETQARRHLRPSVDRAQRRRGRAGRRAVRAIPLRATACSETTVRSVRPRLRSPSTYHLVCRPDGLEDPRIVALRDWLVDALA